MPMQTNYFLIGKGRMAIKETIELNVSSFVNSLNQARVEVQKTGDAIKNSLEKPIDVSVNTSGLKKIEADAKKSAQVLETSFTQAAKGSADKMDKEFDGFFTNFKNKIKEGQAEASSGGGIFGSLASGIGQLASPIGAATAGLAALGAGLVSAFTSGQAYNAALGDLQAKTGETGETFERLKLAAEDAFRGGVGESVADATRVIAQSQNLLGSVFDPEQLSQFTVRAQALGNLFDKDVNEVIAKASPFVKQFGLDSETAFNLLGTALQQGGTASDDVLDSLAEYSQLAVEAGLSAQEFTTILTRGAEDGAFSTDKIADSLKEAQIRLKAGDFEKAFGDIIGGADGVSASIAQQALEFQRLGQTGAISVKEALTGSASVIKEALEAGEISESFASQLQVAVAGTPAEDLGTDLFNKIFGAPFDENLINQKAAEVGKLIDGATGQYTFIETIQRQFTAFIEIGGQQLVNFLNNVIGPAFDGWWAYFENAFVIPFQNIWQVLVDSFAPISELINEVFGSAEGQAISFRDVMESVGKVIGILVNVALVPLRVIINQVSNAITAGIQIYQAFISTINNLRTSSSFLGTIINGVIDGFTSLANGIGVVIDYITDFFNALGKAKPQAPFKDTNKDAKDAEASVKKATQAVDQNTKAQETNTKAVKDKAKANDDAAKAQEELEKFLLASANRIGKTEQDIEKLRTQALINALQERRKAIEADVNLSAKDRVSNLLEIDLEVIDIERRAKLKALQDSFKAEIDAAKANTANFIKEKKLEGAGKIAVEEALKGELRQLEIEFELSRQSIVDSSESKIQELRKKSLVETQRLLVQQAQANADAITAAQQSALNDQQAGIQAYNNLIESLTQDADDLATKLADRFQAKRPTIEKDDTISRETEELRQQLASRQITYAAFVGNIRGQQGELSEAISEPWYEALGVVEGVMLSLNQVIGKELDTTKELFEASTKQIVRDLNGDIQLVEKEYETVIELLNDVAVAGGDLLLATLAQAVVEGENVAKQLGLVFLDMLQSLIPAFTAMIWGNALSAPQNIATGFTWGTVAGAATTGILLGLVQAAKSAIGGAWTGALPGVKSPEAQKNPNDTTMIWWNPREAIVPANITEREMPLLKALFAGKTSEQFFNENYQPRFNIATPSVNVSGGGDAKTQRLLEQIVSNTSRKTSGRMAIEHEFAPLRLSSDGLVAEYKRSLARELRRV